MPLSDQLVGVIVGGLLVGFFTIFGNIILALYKQRSIKKKTSKALLAEIELNQEFLKGLLETKHRTISFFKVGGYDRTVYLALTDKLGFLDSEILEKVAKYYGHLHFLEVRLSAIREGPTSIDGIKDTYTDEWLAQQFEYYLEDAKKNL